MRLHLCHKWKTSVPHLQLLPMSRQVHRWYTLVHMYWLVSNDVSCAQSLTIWLWSSSGFDHGIVYSLVFGLNFEDLETLWPWLCASSACVSTGPALVSTDSVRTFSWGCRRWEDSSEFQRLRPKANNHFVIWWELLENDISSERNRYRWRIHRRKFKYLNAKGFLFSETHFLKIIK